MLKALSVTDLPTSISLLREDAAIFDDIFQPMMADADDLYDDDGDDSKGDGGGEGGNGKGRSKSRRELPSGAVATLKAWLLSPEHFTHPYPTPQDQAMLMQKTGIDKKQLKNWFTNARRRIWKPMLKKQIEQGKLATSGPGGVVPVGGGVPGLTMISTMPGGVPTMSGSTLDNPHSVQAMRVHYQQVVQQQQDSLQQQQQLLQQQQQQQVRCFPEISIHPSIHLLLFLSVPFSCFSRLFLFHNRLATSAATSPSSNIRRVRKRRVLFGTIRDGFVLYIVAATTESARLYTKSVGYQRIHRDAAATVLQCPAQQDGQSRGAHGVVCARSGSGATSDRICPAQGGKQTTSRCFCFCFRSIISARRRWWSAATSLKPASDEGSFFPDAGYQHGSSGAHAKLLAALFQHHVSQQPRDHARSQEHCELEWG
jgi:Homeobox KN domain